MISCQQPFTAYSLCYYRGGEAVTRPKPQYMISTKGNTPLIKTPLNTFFIINALLHPQTLIT